MITRNQLYMLLFALVSLGSCKNNTGVPVPEDLSYKNQRKWMVNTQLKQRGITDENILKAFMNVERHLFVNPGDRDKAYGDHPVSIGYGQTISQPYIVAYMTQMLNLDKTSKVLEIGTGSGYQAAILGEICDTVFTIEIQDELGQRARKILDSLDYDNVFVRIGDGYAGLPRHAPFDAIIVTCATTHVPQTLKDQLAEGGKIVIPVGPRFSQELVLLEKRGNHIRRNTNLEVMFVPMVDETGQGY